MSRSNVVKHHVVTLRFREENPLSIFADIAHPDYGVIPGTYIPKSVIAPDDVKILSAATTGDHVEVAIQGWWFRKNLGYPDKTPEPPVPKKRKLRRPI